MTQDKVISLEMTEMEMGDRGSKSDNVCKRATSRRFLESYLDSVRCTLVAGKPVFGRKVNFLYHNHRYGRAFLH